MSSRRHFLATTFAASLTAALSAQEKRRPRILLRSSWHTVNIGDLARTPGVLALPGKYLPELARVAPAVLALARDPAAAKAKAARARELVEERQRALTTTLRRTLSLA